MKVREIAFAVLLSLSASPIYAADRDMEVKKAGAAAVGGAVVGAGTFAAIGSGGLVIAGSAFAVGAVPFIAAGAVVGLAGYGVYSAIAEPETKATTVAAKPKISKKTGN
ncbi:MAG: hypothetical protein WC710_09325 [Gallionella sp.]|jgi:hypothetical protein